MQKFNGPKFRAERERLKITKTGLAKALQGLGHKGAHRVMVWQWENGRTPSAAYLQSIAKLLEKPTDFFFEK